MYFYCTTSSQNTNTVNGPFRYLMLRFTFPFHWYTGNQITPLNPTTPSRKKVMMSYISESLLSIWKSIIYLSNSVNRWKVYFEKRQITNRNYKELYLRLKTVFYLCLFAHTGVKYVLTMSSMAGVHVLTLRGNLRSPPVSGGVRVTHFVRMYSMLTMSLDCPFLIAPLVFSNVYFERVCFTRFIYCDFYV